MVAKPENSFTLPELAALLMILALLAGVLVPRVTDRLATDRDSERLADIRAVRTAIEQYFLDRGAYPPPGTARDSGGYDVSSDGDFIPELARTGYLRAPVADPLNDPEHAYAYNVYPPGAHGCSGDGRFYVLAIRRFETAGFAEEHAATFQCAQHDWSTEFDHVTGGGTSHMLPRGALQAAVK